MKCPNRNLQEYKNLEEQYGSSLAHYYWSKYDGVIPSNIINYSLKAVDILSSDKAKQVFAKGEKNGWDLNKILTELQVPKEQKQLILDKNIKSTQSENIEPTILLPIGTSGSGKSTFIKTLPKDKYIVISPDEMRVEFTGNIDDKSKDKEIYEVVKERAIQAIKNNKSVIIDTTNLQKDRRRDFISAINSVLPNTKIEYKLLELNPELAKQRIKAQIERGEDRANVPDSTIDRHALLYKEMLEDIKSENISQLKEDNSSNLREEIITSLMADNSFTVEVTTALSEGVYDPTDIDNFDPETLESNVEKDRGTPTKHYSNLTVPGGTNYTENEVSVPGVTPNIKGHATFSTDNGIGWFRSDEKNLNVSNIKNDAELTTLLQKLDTDSLNDAEVNRVNELKDFSKVSSKTRRILEVQSDLFQKGRDNDVLTVSKEDQENAEAAGMIATRDSLPNKNNFLQLLNKKGNWVNFFIQSIVQDSVKKSYEKVLFPTGDTAAKVEGHQTIADEIKKIDDNIKKTQSEIDNKQYQFETEKNLTEEELVFAVTKEGLLENLKNLNKQKQEMKTQGLEKLKPVEAFYTNRVTNLLNKLYDVNKITDEHGNTWNEIDLKNINNTFLLASKPKLTDLLDEKAENFLFIKEETVEVEENLSAQTASKSRVLFGTEDKSFTAKEVLDNIITNYTGFSKFTKGLIKNLLPLIYKTNAKIRFVDESRLESSVVMLYNTYTNEILINKNRFRNYSIETIISSFMHEAVHSVTVNAYADAQTMDEKAFKLFIDEMYAKYRSLSDGKAHGFTKPVEFIAELMTNEEFQTEMQELEYSSTKSFWDTFINYVRGLLGLAKNSDYNKIVDAIIKVVNKNDYNGGIKEILYASKKKERTYYDLETIEKRRTFILDSIKDNLEENLRRYDNLVRKLKDPTKLKKHAKKLKEVFNNIKSFDEAKKWKAISTFSVSLIQNINSLKRNFDKEDLNANDIKNTTLLYKKYLTAHSLITEILAFMADMKKADQTTISKADIIKLEDELSIAKGQYDALTNNLFVITRDGIGEVLNNRKYAGKIMASWKAKLGRQYDTLKPAENKTSWVNRKMTSKEDGYADEIDVDVKKYADGIVNNVHFDITWGTHMFVSAISTNSKLVQIMQKLINTLRENIVSRDRANDFILNDLYTRWIKEKGKNISPAKAFDNLIEYAKNGQVYLKGENKLAFREAYETRLNKYKILKEETESKYGRNAPQFVNLFKNSDLRKWVKDNTKSVVDNKGNETRIAINKWKNDLSTLSDIEKEVLLKFREISITTKKQTFGMKPIISKHLFGSPYYLLPSITKSDLERVISGDALGIAKDSWKDLTEIRVDDVGFSTAKKDLAGNSVYDVKINFRGPIKRQHQSLDLFTVYRLEAKNGVNFDEKHKAEGDMTSLVEISKNKKYYETKQGRLPIVGFLNLRNKAAIIKGEESTTYKRMVSLMESNLYDMMNKDAGKLGPFDLNKVVRTLNGWTARLGLWLNEVAAPVNVLNGKSQLFLEIIAGNHIKAKSLAKAEVSYLNDLPNIVKDNTRPIKLSMTNQLNQIFDTFGLVSVRAEQAFIKNTILKANLEGASLQFMQDSGEHWLQSVLTQAVLDTIKVMDKDNNLLNKLGQIVNNESEAASLLDMYSIVDGKATLDSKVVYTTRNSGIKFNEGGKEMIKDFIKAKIFATMGNYDSNMQPEVMRHAGGKLLIMFRRFLVELGINRLRGFEHFGKAKEDLLEEEKFFSDALQEDVEGMYVTTLRYFINGILPQLKTLNFKIMSQNWKELSSTEKKNIHKTITEIAISATLYQAVLLMVGLAGGDGDDDEGLYYIMLIMARLESELMSYIDPRQQYKILDSPIPSLRVVESLISLTTSLAPWNWTERDGNDILKLQKAVERVTPVLNLHKPGFTYKKKLQYLNYRTD